MEDLEGYRYELKMLLADVDVAAARGWIRAHPLLFRQSFVPRRVNNIYFDTQDYDWMRDHIDGAPRRAKLRLRWYGEGWAFTASQLELKVKESYLGRKESMPISAAIDLAHMPWSQITGLIAAGCDDLFRARLAGTQPVLINTYRREYYVSADGAIRATLDLDLWACSQAFGQSPRLDSPQPQRDLAIIELKARAGEYERLSEALTSFPARTIHFSKFLSGMESGI